jgi:hypothetical protein
MGVGLAVEGVLAYLEVRFEDEEGIRMHGRVADADDGSIGDIDSEEDVDLRQYFDSFRQRKRKSPPFELHAPLIHFEVGQVEECIVPSVASLRSFGELICVNVVVESGNGEPGCQIERFHCYKFRSANDYR